MWGEDTKIHVAGFQRERGRSPARHGRVMPGPRTSILQYTWYNTAAVFVRYPHYNIIIGALYHCTYGESNR